VCVSSCCKIALIEHHEYADPWGGWYAMNAHNGDTINATNTILPPGFTVAPCTLPNDEYLMVNPVSTDCLLVILRDANNNRYSLCSFGKLPRIPSSVSTGFTKWCMATKPCGQQPTTPTAPTLKLSWPPRRCPCMS
jgi:hypothetical protein